MDIDKIKVYTAEDIDYITGLDKEQTKIWYARSIGVDIELIESFNEVEDLENEGFWNGKFTIGEVITIVESASDNNEIKVMRTSEGYYAIWTSLKDEILLRYKDREFEHCIICSTEY